MRKVYFLIAAFFCLLLSNVQAQEGSVEQWQNNPAIRKNARVDALLKSSNHLSRINSKRSIVPVPDKPAYGFLMDNNEVPDKLGMISFRLPKPDIYTTIMPADMNNIVWTGVYVEDTYYAFMVRVSASGFAFPTYLATIDLTTGERRNILDISFLGQGADDITFADMTYDYSTSTVYATANTGLFQSSLYKFSLVDGTITPVAELGIEHYLVSLACSYEGQLYGMSTGGELYRINKEDGSAEVVGNTGYKPWYIQSMEFDHTDNQLYWAGADAEHSFIARIDTQTGEAYEMGTFVPNSQIMGLYIPFTRVLKGAPDKVTDLIITPGQKGDLSSTLSWANPIADPFSNKLTGKLGIKIYRNNELLADITNKEPGERCSFTDKNFSTNGNYNYRLVPYNSAGTGELLKKDVWIGEDTPSAPENITTIVDGTSVIIGWAAPSIGTHGGWINEAKLKYSITRLPDNATIATSLTERSYTDKKLESLAKWSYKVTVTDDIGNTADAKSDPVIAGPGLMPFIERFDSNNSTDLWSFFNLNADDYFWNWILDYDNRSNGCMAYPHCYIQSAKEWLLTPPMKLEAQHRYKISFDKRTFNHSFDRWKEELTLTVGKSPHPQQQTTTLAEIVFDNYDWDNYTAEFVPEDNSNYYFGFYLHSKENCGEPGIDNVIIKEVFFYDLQTVLIEGPQSAVVKLPSDFTVTVRNEGSRPVTSYKIVLTDENGNALAEPVTIEEVINPGETKKHKLQWRPEEVKVQNVKAVVIVTADGDETNNISNIISVDIQDPNAPRTATLGTKEISERWPFIFETYGQARSQSIYLASEINSPGGIITSLKWYSNFKELAVNNQPVQIYMANTSETSLKDNWIDDSQLVLVYEGNVSIAKKQEILDVVLNGVFLYTGQNLCVDVRKVATDDYSWRDGFYNYTLPEQTSPTRFRTFDDRVTDKKPMLTIQLNSAGAKMSGKITCAGQPVEDVLVKIEENGLNAKTGADGTYKFDLINYGTYHISYYIHGYFKVVKEITITDTTPIVEDIALTKMPQVKVKGSIDNKLIVPAQEVEVNLKGYGDYVATTDANGAFEFADVYAADTYELSVSINNYAPFTKQIDMNVQSDVELGSLVLDEIPYPAYGLSLNENTLNWNAPAEQKECRYDDGTMAQTAGFLPQFTSNKSLFGAVYQAPGKVTKVKWYIASLKGETTKKVNLFIMNIDAEGTPTAEPIYIAEDIISSCGTWFEYSLSNPAVAPNGFLVGIGSSTESVNLGVDTGVDENYPDVSNTRMFFTDDYNVQYAKASLYGANFMIRANYIDLEPEALSTAGLIEGYNIYRMREGDESNKESWKLLNKVTAVSYTDATLADAEKGYYRYGVSVSWKGVPESEALISDVIAKDMLTRVSMHIVPNIGDTKAALGAEVSLVCDDGIHKYTAKVTEDNGKLVFDQVHRGIYTVSVSHPRFDLYKKAQIDLSNEPYYSLGTYTLKERLAMPVNLQIKNVEEGSNRYHLEWNLTSAIFEDFESHPDFELNSPGNIGWQYIDNDKGKNTYGIQDTEYPNKGAGTAYIIFNPSATKPRLDGNPDICAWSGDRYLASFSSQKPNDDYFISPELFFSEDFHLSFYARSLMDDYGMERINVGYSTSDAEPQSFTWLVPADYLNINVVWQKYDYVIPADAKHVAIRCLSDNAFLLMIDDVQVGDKTPQVYKSYAKSYKVYLDGTCLTSLTGNTYDFAINGDGSHTVGVEAIYETGVSEKSTLAVNNGSSISDASEKGSFLAYFDGKLVFEGVAGYINIYSSTGMLVAQYTDVTESVSVPSLPQGVYMVHAEINGQRIMNKIIIK